MHAYLWIVTSWIVVAVLCYLWLTVFGNNGVGGQYGATASARRTGEWFNKVIFWLWHSQKFSLAFGETLTKALNDSLKRIAKTGHYCYEGRFELPLSVLTKDNRQSEPTQVDAQSNAAAVDASTDVPHFEHINASLDNAEHLIFNARLHLPKLTLKLCTLDPALEEKTSTHEIVFSDVHGEVEARVAHIADELFVMGCFSGRPEIRVTATPIDADVSAAHNARDLEELARRCFISAVLNFSIGEILYPDSARNSARLSAEIRNLSLLDNIYALGSGDSTTQKQVIELEQQKNFVCRKPPARALIRILGARNLGHNQTPQCPFVTLEVDEPAQKFATESSYNHSSEGCNPQWHETFEININPETKEFLFEVYDNENERRQIGARKFLGLAITGLAELASSSSSDKPIVHKLELQARPYATTTDNVSSTAKNRAENIVSGILLVQCQFVHAEGTTYGVDHPAKFPTHTEELSRGTLKNLTQNYIHNANQQDVPFNGGANDNRNMPSSPVANSPLGVEKWASFDSNKLCEVRSNRSLSRSQSSHLNSSIFISRPESALNRNTSEVPLSTAEVPLAHADLRSSYNSSQFPLIQNEIKMPLPSQYDQQLRNGQPSPYDRFDNRSTTSSIATNKSPLPPVGITSPSLVEPPASPKLVGSHVQFVNNGTAPKHSSPFRTASEKAIGCETFVPTIRTSSKAALIQSNIFEFSPPQKSSENFADNMKDLDRIGTTSPQPPPIPPHHQSRYNAELDKRVADQTRKRESSSPLKTRRDRSFFDTLRERLTRGSTKFTKRGSKRARSLDTQSSDFEEVAVSMPPSRDQSQVRAGISPYSETISISGSTHSTSRIPRLSRDGNIRSTLILEVADNEGGDKNTKRYPNKYHKFENAAGEDKGANQLLDDDEYGNNEQMRYYLIPHDVATQPAAQSLLRAGKKLHVFNNHTFVAVKPRGRVPCSVCSKIITSNFIKQAYQCRDCRKVTHKSCHLRGTSPCQESTLAQLPIIDNVNWEDFFHQYQMLEFISVNGV